MKKTGRRAATCALLACALAGPATAADPLITGPTLVKLGIAFIGKLVELHLRSRMSGRDPVREATLQTREIVKRNHEQLLKVHGAVLGIERAVLRVKRQLKELPGEIRKGVRDEMTLTAAQRYIGAFWLANERIRRHERGAGIGGLDLERIVESIEKHRNELHQRDASSVTPVFVAYLVLEGKLQARAREMALSNVDPGLREASVQSLHSHLDVDIYAPKLIDLWERIEQGEPGLGEGGDAMQREMCGSDPWEADRGLRYWQKMERGLGNRLSAAIVNLEQSYDFMKTYYERREDRKPKECATWVYCSGTSGRNPMKVSSTKKTAAEDAVNKDCPDVSKRHKDYYERSGSVMRCGWRTGTGAVDDEGNPRSRLDFVANEVKRLAAGEHAMNRDVRPCIAKYRAAQQMAYTLEKYQDLIADVVEKLSEKWARELPGPFPWHWSRDGELTRGTGRWKPGIPRKENEYLNESCDGLPIETCYERAMAPFRDWSDRVPGAWEHERMCYIETRKENETSTRFSGILDYPGPFAEEEPMEEADRFFKDGRECRWRDEERYGRWSGTRQSAYWCRKDCEGEHRVSDFTEPLEAKMWYRRRERPIPWEWILHPERKAKRGYY